MYFLVVALRVALAGLALTVFLQNELLSTWQPLPADQVQLNEVGWNYEDDSSSPVAALLLSFVIGIPLGVSGILRRRYHRLDVSQRIYGLNHLQQKGYQHDLRHFRKARNEKLCLPEAVLREGSEARCENRKQD